MVAEVGKLVEIERCLPKMTARPVRRFHVSRKKWVLAGCATRLLSHTRTDPERLLLPRISRQRYNLRRPNVNTVPRDGLSCGIKRAESPEHRFTLSRVPSQGRQHNSVRKRIADVILDGRQKNRVRTDFDENIVSIERDLCDGASKQDRLAKIAHP